MNIEPQNVEGRLDYGGHFDILQSAFYILRLKAVFVIHIESGALLRS